MPKYKNLTPKLIEGFFDKSISFNYKLFKKDFDFIIKNRISIQDRHYNFEKKTIQHFLNQRNNISFLIVEGIFAREFLCTLYNQNYFLLELKVNKNECIKRVVQRDFKERGKSKKQSMNNFLKSWNIYYEKLKNTKIKNNIYEITITKKDNIDQILKKIFN